MTLKRNTTYNLLGAVLPIAVSLLTVPAYLHLIGEARFGILAVAWLLLGYFGLFDLGLGIATTHHVAAVPGEKQGLERAQIFWSALASNLALGIIGGAILWPVANYYFAYVIQADAALRREMLNAVPWLVMAVPLATLTGVLAGGLQGVKQFAILNGVSAGGTILFQVLPLTAAFYWSPKLSVVLPVAIGTRAITVALLFVLNLLLLTRGHRPCFSKRHALILLSFGGWLTISAFFSPLLSILDRFTIGAAFNAAAIAYYAVPLNLGERLSILGNSTAFAAFPEFSAGNKDQARALSVRLEKYLMATMLLMCVGGIFLIEPFLAVWIGGPFSKSSAYIGTIILVGIWADSVSRVALYANRATGGNRAVAIIDLLQVPIIVAAIYGGLKLFGLAGVALAYAFRIFLNYALLSHLLGTKAEVGPPTGMCLVVLALAALLSNQFEPNTYAWLTSFAVCLIVAALTSYGILPRAARTKVTGGAQGLFHALSQRMKQSDRYGERK